MSVLPKENEKIGLPIKVIKFSSDTDFINKKSGKEKILKGFVPEVTNFSKTCMFMNMLKEMYLKKDNKNIFEELQSVLDNFWKTKKLDDKELIKFNSVCSEFYKDKTYERVNNYLDRYPEDINEYNLNKQLFTYL